MNPLLPPDDLIRWTGSDNATAFKTTGETFARYLVERMGVHPETRLIDVGCGCGRIALPLLNYFGIKGRYEGVDVDPRSIAWARENITAENPAFRFTHADVHNTTYNADGQVPSYRYRLPFNDESFDSAVLTSVFTHMLPQGLENYLAEVSRVLVPGGQCLMTFFLLNDESSRLVREGNSDYQFPYRYGDAAVQSREDPESVIGYDEPGVQKLLTGCGLAAESQPEYGRWCGRDATNYQDIVIVRKMRTIPRHQRIARRLRLYRFKAPVYVPEPNFTRHMAAA